MSACKTYPKYKPSGVVWLFRPNGAPYLSPGQRAQGNALGPTSHNDTQP